jgi:penicillin-insensitive murein endopeptidase
MKRLFRAVLASEEDKPLNRIFPVSRMNLPGDNPVRRTALVWGVAIFVAACLVAACASVATHYELGSATDSTLDTTAHSGDRPQVEVEPQPPPFIAPPEPAAETWAMPDIEQREPSFPWLPGESPQVSRSVGDTTHGWLVNARRIPQPHPHIRTLPVQYERGLNFTSDQMFVIIEEAAAHVASEYPRSLVRLGNFSAQGGGDIPYSVSHNSGRDGDLGFFVVGPDGKPTEPAGLVPLDEQGRYETDDGVFVFDAPRNWALIEGLIESADGQLQYIFVSDPLRRVLLDEARRQGAPRDVISKAETLLHQPGGALPHNDHFHVRIYCSEIDVRSGCQNAGRRLVGYRSYRHARIETAKEAAVALGAADASVRLAAVRRLALLEARSRADEIEARLVDDSAKVRAAASRALGRLGRGATAIAKRLPDENEPQVVAEMINALGRLGGASALDALIAELAKPRPIDLVGSFSTDARTFVAEALISTESAKPVPVLIAALGSERVDVRISAARALRILTNHRLGTDEELLAGDSAQLAVQRWQQWYAEHGDEDRDAWLACGFQDAGYGVDRLSANHVWDLCRAVAADDYLSYNAQRVLMRISGREPASLSWSKNDANFYWRRWFERRWRRFGAPPIPQELSTLD